MTLKAQRLFYIPYIPHTPTYDIQQYTTLDRWAENTFCTPHTLFTNLAASFSLPFAHYKTQTNDSVVAVFTCKQPLSM